MFRCCCLPWALLALLAWGGPTRLVLTADAGPSGDSEHSYRVARWTVENRLPQSSIKALAQTPDGYLWVGTLRGLARFDGVKFKVFDHSNTPEMTHDSINDLTVDAQDGGLWIGTGVGLLYYRGHHFERYNQKDGVPGAAGPLWAAREGGVWFSPEPGKVALARAGRVRTWKFAPNLADNAVDQLSEETSSEMLVLLGPPGNGHAVSRLNLSTESVTPLRMPTDTVQMRALCSSFVKGTSDLLWLCTGCGIWRGNEKTWTRITSADPESGVWPQRIYRTRDGQTWVTQFEGVHISLQRLLHGRLEPFTAPDMPSDLYITHLLEDREGNLWVGTTTGLLRLEPKRIRVYSRRDGMRNDDTLALARGADGTIWVGTAEGISGIRNGQITNLPPPDARGTWKDVPVFLADHENRLWLGWPEFWLARLQEGKWECMRAPAEAGNAGYFKAIAEDREGRVWIAVGDDLLLNDGGHWTHFSTNNGLSHPDVRVVHQDRRGDLWFGTFGGGLNRYHDGRFTSYKTDRSERNNRAWWIHEDSDGVFWVGSEDGLNRFVPPGVASPGLPTALSTSAAMDNGGRDRFFTFTMQQGLGENVVNNIQEDDFGNLWLSGLHGIYRVSRQELNEVAAGTRSSVRCLAFSEADGMLNSECNGGDNQPSGCKDDKGRIWFPTPQGVVVIDPKEVQGTELPPPVVIEQVRANGRGIYGDDFEDQQRSSLGHRLEGDKRRPASAATKTLIPPGGARVLEIHYTANTLVAPERVRFKYRLEGYDPDWKWDDQNRRGASYTDLRPGDYTFRVLACNSHGIWNEQGDLFSFRVAAHYYETWAFYLACAAFIAFSGLTVHYWRIRGLRRLQHLEQQRAFNEERVRIAKDLHDDLGANLTGLALQLDLAGSQGRSGDALKEQLTRLARNTRELVDIMREVVWAMNPQQDNIESLACFLGQYTESYLAAAGIRCRLDLPSGGPEQALSSKARHQLFLVVKEALHNVVRHAQASQVQLRLARLQDELRLTISDNGRGLTPNPMGFAGHGLDNMKERVTSLGGEFSARRGTAGGALLTIILPLRRLEPTLPP